MKTKQTKLTKRITSDTMDMEQVEIDHEPSLDDMAKLMASQFHVFDDTLYVRATGLYDDRESATLMYACPYCPRRAQFIHSHGTTKDTTTRYEHRYCHCDNPKTLSVNIAIIGPILEEYKKTGKK